MVTNADGGTKNSHNSPQYFCEYLLTAGKCDVNAIRGWNLGPSLDVSLTLEALQLVWEDHVPQMHHSDQIIQYAAWAYVKDVRWKATHSFIATIF